MIEVGHSHALTRRPGKGWLAVVLLALAFVLPNAVAQAPAPVNDRAIMAERPPELLSAYRLFRDAGAREPNARVTPYDLNTPLWSDGALKFRYVYLPQGAQARYNAETVFDFPVGTVLVKTFAFAEDMRAPTENVRFLETRLLIRHAEGWVALPYVWNEDQTEARYAPVGADIPVSFTNDAGQAVALDWHVPNRNECRACHDRAGAITPIGPSARNLNREVMIPPGMVSLADGHIALELEPGPWNQLRAWAWLGLVDATASQSLNGGAYRSLIEELDEAPRVPNAYDSNDGALDARARAYLDVNCAHCHNPEGPGHTSGLDLRWSQREPAQWGVFKRPIAAGRASGGFAFSIEPGHPERSILVHRMASTDPGVMMPETGRTLVDEPAVALMREWIAGMNRDGGQR